MTYIDELFDIKSTELVSEIEKDRLRLAEDKVEDLKFYEDQKKNRKMFLGEHDDAYKKKCDDKKKRELANEKYLEKQSNQDFFDNTDIPTSAASEEVMEVIREDIEPTNSDFNMNDPNFEQPNPKKQMPKKDTVTLEVPRDILRKVSLNNARLGIGAKSQVLALAEIINQSGGSPADFAISTSSAKR